MSVIRAAEPKVAYENLSDESRTLFHQWADPATYEIGVAEVPSKSPEANCKYYKASDKAKSIYGNTLYTFWTGAKVCFRGNHITTADHWETGGETSTPGWRYEGIKDKGAHVWHADVKARVWAKHEFVLGAGGWDPQRKHHCLRVGVNGDGSQMSDRKCTTVP